MKTTERFIAVLLCLTSASAMAEVGDNYKNCVSQKIQTISKQWTPGNSCNARELQRQIMATYSSCKMEVISSETENLVSFASKMPILNLALDREISKTATKQCKNPIWIAQQGLHLQIGDDARKKLESIGAVLKDPELETSAPEHNTSSKEEDSEPPAKQAQ